MVTEWRKVDPAPGERLAPEHPPYREGNSSKDADLADRRFRVVRAARVEAAVPSEHGPQGQAVRADQPDHSQTRRPAGDPQDAPDPPHLTIAPAAARAPVTSAVTSCAFASLISGRATRTTSQVPARRGATDLQASRRRRRARFRITAPPTERALTNAAREAPSECRTYSTTRPRGKRRPERSTERTSAPRCRRPDGGAWGEGMGVGTRLPPSGGQVHAPLRATSRQDGPAASGPHADPEPVRLVTLAVVRLKRTLAHVGILARGTRERGRRAPERPPAPLSIPVRRPAKRASRPPRRLGAAPKPDARIRAAWSGSSPPSAREAPVSTSVDIGCG